MPVFYVIEYWLGSFVFLQGIHSSIAKKPYILVIFSLRGGGVDPLHPLDPPMYFLVFVVWPMIFSLIFADV